MRAVDTNVLVRLLTADYEVQHGRARRLFDADQLFIATSVLLETEWVLRESYRLDKLKIVHDLRRLAGLDNMTVQDQLLLSRAIEWAESGMDFADALHLAASSGCIDFVSFDEPLARRAARLDALPVVQP